MTRVAFTPARDVQICGGQIPSTGNFDEVRTCQSPSTRSKADRHTSFYLAAGPENGPLIIFVHGWPELSISWRHQLPALAALGFRAIAPDMRGYGRSSVYGKHGDYAQELIVRDMIELLDSTGRKKAVWVGHDWGSPVVWNVASHHPDRCEAVASLCVPYYTIDRGLDHTLIAGRSQALSRKRISRRPVGVHALLRGELRGSDRPDGCESAQLPEARVSQRRSAGRGQRAVTSMARKGRGVGGATFPDVPLDTDVISEEDLSVYASALERNGFFGPSSWYMNHATNAAYGRKAANDGYLDMPVLFHRGVVRLRLRVGAFAPRRADAQVLPQLSARRSYAPVTGSRRKSRSR